MSSAKRVEIVDDGVVGRLRHAMTVAGFTNRDLSDRSGVKLGSLNAYLAGSRRLPAAAVPGLARALSVSCDYLLTGEPAALDPGILWQTLNDPRFTPGVLSAFEFEESPPAFHGLSEQCALSFYGIYTAIYLETLSRYGRDFSCWDQSRDLVDAFTARVEHSIDPRLKRLRELFPLF